MSNDAQLYDEFFTVTSLDKGKYERVARLAGTSDGNADTSMTLDINTELYPCEKGEKLHVVLASTLALDGSTGKEDGKETTDDSVGAWRNNGRDGQTSLSDLFDYVCRGKIYRFEEGAGAENLYVARHLKPPIALLTIQQEGVHFFRGAFDVSRGTIQEAYRTAHRPRLLVH